MNLNPAGLLITLAAIEISSLEDRWPGWDKDIPCGNYRNRVILPLEAQQQGSSDGRGKDEQVVLNSRPIRPDPVDYSTADFNEADRIKDKFFGC